MKLVIVESPAKAKTINKYLGKDYQVLASFGHIRDLPSKDGSVLPDEDFAMTWELSPGGKKRLQDIVKAVKEADTIVLASDPDREGEAIAWHILEELKAKKLLKDKKIERVVFHEITKSAVTEAIKNPRQIDDNLVSAYMARRALDYLVGFTLSPVLWRKLPGSKSAGRVQSVALRLVCERENEIERFKAEEYWTIDAELFTQTKALIKSHLIQLDGKKLEKFDINTEAKALEAKAKIEAQDFSIANVERKKANRYPAPPFTTSTLQQEAARKLRFSAKKTMQVAQKLYEDGYITYMRTDAVNLSQEAVSACRDAILKYFGEAYLPKSAKEYKTKSKNAQEAHEAIRPSDVMNTPKKMEAKLDTDGYKLYELIWKRTVACQMNPAVLDKVVIDAVSADTKIMLRANGQVIAFDGFLKLYQESFDDEEENDENRILPNVEAGEKETKGEIFTDQHFTAPPPRFTEASLVKKLEELGIGRPSTYAPTISTIQQREYVEKGNKDGEERQFNVMTLKDHQIKDENHTEITGAEKAKLLPTDIGTVVNDFLTEYFPDILDFNFTASVEKEFDEIAEGEVKWTSIMKNFYDKFHPSVENTLAIKTEHKVGERILGEDPETGKPISVKIGRFGPVVQIGTVEDEEKPRFAQMKKGQSMETITLEEALELFKLPRTLGEYEGKTVSVGVGRFGPYILHNKVYVSLPKGLDPMEVTLEEAEDIVPQDLTLKSCLDLIKLQDEKGANPAPKKKFSKKK